jgi:glycosyltransferase involved in cell wall biosynthesis
MKIAVWHNLHSGGGSRALQYHIQGLVEHGHHVEVWAPNPDAGGFMKLPVSVVLHKVALSHSKVNPSFKEKISLLFFEKEVNMLAMETHCMQCADEIHAGNFDILLANSCSYFAVPFIGRFVKIPKVLYLGEPMRFLYEAMPKQVWEAPERKQNKLSLEYWTHTFSSAWRLNRFRTFVREEWKNYQAFDKVLVNSYFSAESCQRVYGLPSEVCYLGIDTEIFRPVAKLSENDTYVVGLGSFMRHKNPEFAIRALGLIKENRPKLCWIGNLSDDEYWTEMAILAQKVGVEIELKKMVSDDELIRLLGGAVCMVYTSKLEPFGFAPLEANACGTPVVAIAEGGVRETVAHGKNGFLSNKNTIEMAKYIEQLINESKLRDEMSKFAIKNVQENWSLKAGSERINNALIEQVK